MPKLTADNVLSELNTAWNTFMTAYYGIRQDDILKQNATAVRDLIPGTVERWFTFNKSTHTNIASFVKKTESPSFTANDIELFENLLTALHSCASVIENKLDSTVINTIYETAQSLPGASSPKLTALSYALFAFAAVALVLGILGFVFTAGGSLALGGVVAVKLSALATALNMAPVAAIGTVAATGVGVGLVGGGVTTLFNQKTGLAKAVETLAGPKPEESAGDSSEESFTVWDNN